jgi:Tol biopolymer transport system component
VVAGSVLGHVRAFVTVGGTSDSSIVRVVPPGSVAAMSRPNHTGETGSIYTFSFGGSPHRVRAVSVGPSYGPEMSLAWLTGTKLVYADLVPGVSRSLFVVDLETGANTRFTPQADWMEEETFPRVSRDGSWVYFSGGNWPQRLLYRARADGTGKEALPSGIPWLSRESGADPSPDGGRIAFVKESTYDADAELYVMDLATRQSVPLGVKGILPRWSPDGTRIAYAGEPSSAPESSGMRPPMIINADGTGARRLGTAHLFSEVSWSPDGKYVVAAINRNRELVIIDVENGNEVRFVPPGIGQWLKSLVWKP